MAVAEYSTPKTVSNLLSGGKKKSDNSRQDTNYCAGIIKRKQSMLKGKKKWYNTSFSRQDW